MQTFAHIQDGIVREVLSIPDGLVLGEDLYIPAFAAECVPCDETVVSGMLYDADKETFSEAPPPVRPVPDTISDRQFFQQLATDGDITEDEALAAVTVGSMPQKLSDAVASLPAAQQFPAKMLICGATQFQRSNKMVPLLGQALGKDAAALDTIWTAASEL